MTTDGVAGVCEPQFAPLRDLLAANFADGTDTGASVALVHDGRLVVDLWGGRARSGTPWTENTLVQLWSVTKTMTALTALVLVERGVLDLDAPVHSYWPAFRRSDVLVRHVLAHTSGYAGWSDRLDVDTMLDLPRSEAMLAAQEPWWTPGDGSGYNMLSYGHLVDGLVRAATGVPLDEHFRTLVAEPLGADLHLGLPASDDDRCADLTPPPPGGIDYSALPADSLLFRAVLNPVLDVADLTGSRRWRSTPVGAVNGYGNARSVARVQSVVSHGGVLDGVRLLSPATIERILTPQAEGQDQILLTPLRWGVGYALPEPASAPAVPTGRVCWWTGWGGSIVVNDLDRRATFAYTMNRMEQHMTSSPRTDGYVRTAFACLDA